jgi:hypothetical protein
MVPADGYVLDGDYLNFTDASFDGTPHPVLTVRNEHVAHIAWIEDWMAEQRKSAEAEAFRIATEREDIESLFPPGMRVEWRLDLSGDLDEPPERG